jgi:hypothetical protein
MNLSKALNTTFILVSLALTAPSFAKKLVAILETAIEGKKAKLDRAELSYITEVFRKAALETLGTSKFHIMTKDNILMMLPPGKSLSECVGVDSRLV